MDVGMYHLLAEDGQKIQYFVCLGLYIGLGIFQIWASKSFLQATHQEYHNRSAFLRFHFKFVENPQFLMATIFIAVALHLIKAIVPPPEHLPYLFNYLFAVFGFWYNAYFFGLGNIMAMDIMDEIMRRHKRE